MHNFYSKNKYQTKLLILISTLFLSSCKTKSQNSDDLPEETTSTRNSRHTKKGELNSPKYTGKQLKIPTQKTELPLTEEDSKLLKELKEDFKHQKINDTFQGLFCTSSIIIDINEVKNINDVIVAFETSFKKANEKVCTGGSKKFLELIEFLNKFGLIKGSELIQRTMQRRVSYFDWETTKLDNISKGQVSVTTGISGNKICSQLLEDKTLFNNLNNKLKTKILALEIRPILIKRTKFITNLEEDIRMLYFFTTRNGGFSGVNYKLLTNNIPALQGRYTRSHKLTTSESPHILNVGTIKNHLQVQDGSTLTIKLVGHGAHPNNYNDTEKVDITYRIDKEPNGDWKFTTTKVESS